MESYFSQVRWLYLLCSSSEFTDSCLRRGACLLWLDSWLSKEMRFLNGGWLKVWARRRNCIPDSGSSSGKAGGEPGGDWPGDSSSCWERQEKKTIIKANLGKNQLRMHIKKPKRSRPDRNPTSGLTVCTLAQQRGYVLHSGWLRPRAWWCNSHIYCILMDNDPMTHRVAEYWWEGPLCIKTTISSHHAFRDVLPRGSDMTTQGHLCCSPQKGETRRPNHQILTGQKRKRQERRQTDWTGVSCS